MTVSGVRGIQRRPVGGADVAWDLQKEARAAGSRVRKPLRAMEALARFTLQVHQFHRLLFACEL